MAKVWSQASTSCSVIGPKAPPEPALLNTTSSRPKASTASSVMAATSSSTVTSVRVNRNRSAWPRSATAASRARPLSTLRSPHTTDAPSSSQRLTVANPMPLAPPVTIAALPASLSPMTGSVVADPGRARLDRSASGHRLGVDRQAVEQPAGRRLVSRVDRLEADHHGVAAIVWRRGHHPHRGLDRATPIEMAEAAPVDTIVIVVAAPITTAPGHQPVEHLVGAFGEVYVMDWGIAKIVAAGQEDERVSKVHRPPVSSDRETATGIDDSKLTMEGSVMGTAAYMSPEQALGHISELDKRSDVYAIGAMLYELLAGAPPYEAEGNRLNALQIVMARREHGPAPVQKVAAHAPAEVAAICDKAMSDDADERYQDMGEMAADLRAYLEDRVVRAYRTGPIVELTKWVKRNRGTAAVLGLLLLAIVSGLGGINMVQAAGQRRVLRLSDKKVAEFLHEREKDLWPPLPEKREDHEAWLADAEDLLARRADHERAVAELDGKLEGTTNVTANSAVGLDWTDPALQDSWQREVLAELLLDLGELEVLATEVREERLRFALEVEEQTLHGEEARRRWDAAIAGVRGSEKYSGGELTPQLGLLPLGPDPDSGFWEFVHVQTGTEPKRSAETGELQLEPSSGIVFVLLPGGRATIGANRATPDRDLGEPFVDDLLGTDIDEEPAHEVELAPFFMSKYELTQAQWHRIMKTNPSQYSEENGGGPTHPVSRASFFDCREFLMRTDLEFPTEAQYEYAARAGSSFRFPGGNDPQSLVGYANIADLDYRDAGGRGRIDDLRDGHVLPCAVDALSANAFGLHGLHGNVWSWCLDIHAPYGELADGGYSHRVGDGLLLAPGVTDALSTGEAPGVIRGGSYSSDGRNTRSSNRFAYHRINSDGDLGLQPVRRLDPAEPLRD